MLVKPQLSNVSQPSNFSKNLLQTCSQKEPYPSVHRRRLANQLGHGEAKRCAASAALGAASPIYDFLKWWYVRAVVVVFKHYLSILVLLSCRCFAEP